MWDCGDYVIVTNVEKIVVTGKKLQEKLYYTHSGYKGHLTTLTYQQMIDKDPRSVLELAVKGMLPHNKHRAARLKKLKLFVGTDHPYAKQLQTSASFDAKALMVAKK